METPRGQGASAIEKIVQLLACGSYEDEQARPRGHTGSTRVGQEAEGVETAQGPVLFLWEGTGDAG